MNAPVNPLLAECEGCGCDYFTPCPEGCAWDVHYLAEGRAVCTSCAPAMAQLDAIADIDQRRADSLIPEATG